MNYQDLHYLLLLGFNRSNKAIVSKTSLEGLMPGQPKILEFLLEHDGCTQKEIGNGCVLDKSTVTSLLSRMILLEQIVKAPCSQDRRVTRIYLTQKGRALAKRVESICSSVNKAAWQGITQEDRRHFIQTFQNILENLKELETEDEK